MKRPRPRWRDALAALAALATLSSFAALVPTEWRHRQLVDVPAAGVVRLVLPDATFDAAGPQLQDLRLIDAQGTEVPLLVDQLPALPARRLSPRSFTAHLNAGASVLVLETGTTQPIESVSLTTPAPFFLRSARVELSSDGTTWTEVDQGVPLFRQWGAEQMTLSLGGRHASHLRITVSDGRGGPLPFTAAALTVSAGTAPPTVPVGARITARDEFASETVLTLTLDARHVPLERIEFETPEPLFMRRVTVAVRDVQGSIAVERVVGTGTVYRVALDGAASRSHLSLPVICLPLTRELIVRIHHGDSPPLAISGLRVHRHPIEATFLAAAPGAFRLLSGNPQAQPPRYDLSAFASELRAAQIHTLTPGRLEDTAGYAPREALSGPPLPDIPLAGAPLDDAAWTRRKSVTPGPAGVQELELDPAALAGTRSDFADLRLLRDGRQVPYLLELTHLARALALTLEPTPDPKRPSVSIWTLRLPHPGVPLRQVVLTTSSPLFQREFRLFENTTTANGQTYARPLGSTTWSRTPEPGSPATKTISLTSRPQTDTLILETDNGDNPPLNLDLVRGDHPVVRLVFKVAGPEPLTLAYGNPGAPAPRYDLSLVAPRLLTAPRHRATLGAEEADEEGFLRGTLQGLKGGPLFWGALALVVVGLLVVVAKLLPKPPAA